MSWFGGSKSTKEDTAPNFWPAPSYTKGYAVPTDKDTEWMCISNKGFQTETQVWYSILPDGSFLMVQVIWSFLGMFIIPATAQMTFKYYNPNTKQQVWKSVNVGNFKHEGKSCKSDHFNVQNAGSADGEETYTITANLDNQVQLDLVYTKPANALGFKYGQGEDGGYSIFGKEKPIDKREGFVFHRFHPMAWSKGTITIEGKQIDATGDAVFIHAIQSGMRPNLIARRWNFTYFTTGGTAEKSELGSVRAVQMEFQTTDDYGSAGKGSGHTKVNVGAVYTSTLPKSVLLGVGQTSAAKPDQYPTISEDSCVAEHLACLPDSDTGYDAPHGLSFTWAGDRVDGQGKAKASVTVNDAWAGLMEKVDVLAELPYVIRKTVTAVTGAKPYIFQYHNNATLDVELDGKTVSVPGYMFSEASFVSP
ncbi:hypothetical protein CspHIS471_0509780 [Cutaneotrichosporon sp. HIS471]|nr:hypothetical protein CspHIS471_0509780 [Cutaneotrichosporon sp. HIS471]